MEQQRALNALAPYIALSKSASSPRAAADLVTQATSASQTYVFAELLQTPNIQALAHLPDHAPHLRLLEIFAWGSISDYNATPDLPKLNPQQTQKLLLLSLLPLCLSSVALTYSTLQTALSLPDPRALESLITTAIYANLLTAHLDPLHQIVRVTSVAPLRDLAPASVPQLTSVLSEWQTRCSSTLDGIESQIAAIRAKAYDERARQERDERIFGEQLAKAEERREKENKDGGKKGVGSVGSKIGNFFGGRGGGKRSAPSGGGGGFDGEADMMDLDEGGGPGMGTRSTRRRGGGMGR